MSQAIYQMWMMKTKEPWYQLSDEEQANMLAKISESFDAVGAESVVSCDSSWSGEPWQFFGLIKFPDIEAVKKHRQDTNAMNWARYVDAISLLGTEWQP